MPDPLPVPRDQREPVTVKVACPCCPGSSGRFGRADTGYVCSPCKGTGRTTATLASPVDAAAIRWVRLLEKASAGEADLGDHLSLDQAEWSVHDEVRRAVRAAKGGTDATG